MRKDLGVVIANRFLESQFAAQTLFLQSNQYHGKLLCSRPNLLKLTTYIAQGYNHLLC